MKKILVIDESPVVREFLFSKLTDLGFEVLEARNGLDGYLKMRQKEPNLVIIDADIPPMPASEFLKRKFEDPNLGKIPTLLFFRDTASDELIEMGKLGIKKIIAKPIKINMLVHALTEFLNISLKLDETPCTIDVNYNDEIFFIEVSEGLNTEKVELIKYRMAEFMRSHKITEARILLLFAGMDIKSSDFGKLNNFINSIRQSTKVKVENFKVLTNSELLKEFFASLDGFAPAVHSSLADVMDALLGLRASSYMVNGQVHVDFLRVGRAREEEKSTFHLGFQDEVRAAPAPVLESDLATKPVSVAVLDDDPLVHDFVLETFSNTGWQFEIFTNGQDFMNSAKVKNFEILFLDMLMPGMTGAQVMNILKSRNIVIPVIAFVDGGRKDLVLQAIQTGVKCCLLKPMVSQMLYERSFAVLEENS